MSDEVTQGIPAIEVGNPGSITGLPKAGEEPSTAPKVDDQGAPKKDEPAKAPEPAPETPPPGQKPEDTKPPVEPKVDDKSKPTPADWSLLKSTQKAHQEKMAMLKQKYPDVYTELTGKPAGTPAAPVPVTPPAPPAPKAEYGDEDIDAILAGEGPITVDQFTKIIVKAVREENEQYRTQEHEKSAATAVAEEREMSRNLFQQLIYETDPATGQFKKGADGNRVQMVPEQLVKAAFEEVSAYKIIHYGPNGEPVNTKPGDWMANYIALRNALEHLMLLENLSQSTTGLTASIAATEAEKAKRNVMGLQPGAAPTPPAHEETPEEKQIGAIERAGATGRFMSLPKMTR